MNGATRLTNRATGLMNGAADFLTAKPPMQQLLAAWARREWLRPLDTAFAEFLWEEVPQAPPLLILAAALASHQLGRGHACLDLSATLDDPGTALSLPPEGSRAADALDPVPLPAQVLQGVTLTHWQAMLERPELVGSGPGDTPLVRIGVRLYLRRYWHYEQSVRQAIQERLGAPAPETPAATLRPVLDILFPASARAEMATDWQKIACALAARSPVSILTGGPGTGKTSTVVRLLALLQTLALDRPTDPGEPAQPLRIRLAAPTGKAAARLNGSIAEALDRLPFDRLANGAAVRAAIPPKVTTLHRLLGSRPDTRRLRHHAGNPLALDVLVIDEASMIDLEMMAAVLSALPRQARLILLGDRDQLASVEAGAVLGELCRRAAQAHYTPATRDWLHSATGESIGIALVDANGTALDQAIAMLRHSHRFSADSGIGRLAEAVNAGDRQATEQVLADGHADLTLLPVASPDEDALRQLVIDGGYRHYLEAIRQPPPAEGGGQDATDAWASAVLTAHGRFQVLCALRRGPWGVQGLNRLIERLLRQAGLIGATDDWYAGRPVLVTRNDAALGLMHGDIGITLPLDTGPGAGTSTGTGTSRQAPGLRVAFRDIAQPGGVRWVLPVRLQAVETVYALTVHKSQGSEFDHVALLLPDAPSPILTRELLYTGITRARSHLTLVRPGAPRVLQEAVRTRVLRASGLMESD